MQWHYTLYATMDLTRHFLSLSYVMEVIQRGRTAVRPAQVPPLSVVPAVSDGELSEPEYVHFSFWYKFFSLFPNIP